VADETLVYRVAAANAAGMSDWVKVYYPRDPAADHPHGAVTPGNATDLMTGAADDNDPGKIKLTWVAGDNANVYRVAGARRNTDGSFDLSDQIWELVEGDMVNSYTVDSNAMDLSPGTYLFGVIAGHRGDNDQITWSNVWAVADNVQFGQ
jgi:hypothetical protein